MNAIDPTNIFRWSQVIAKMSVIGRRQPCDHLRRIRGIYAITHIQHRTFLRSLASIAWMSWVYQPVVPNVLYFFVFVFVCIHIIANIKYTELYWWVENGMFVPNFNLFFVYWWVSNLTINFVQHKIWMNIHLFYEKKSSVMSLPNSTVSTVVKPMHNGPLLPLWNAVSFFLFTTLEEKNQSNIVVSQSVRFLLYKN